MGLGPSLGTILMVLEKRGEHAKAEDLKRRVAERFKGVVSEAELLKLPVDDIVGTLNLFNELFTEAKKQGILERHIADLKHQGFTVVMGEKYRA